MKKEMLINVMQPEECRIAILEDGVLEELYVERTSHESYVGNIYKGRIVNIEPSIQAAFVDFGVGRNGFLHVSDVEPTYYRSLEPRREGGRHHEGRGRDRDREREFREPAEEERFDALTPPAEPAAPAPEPERLEEPSGRRFGAGLEEDITVAEEPPRPAPAERPVEAVSAPEELPFA